MSMQSVDSSGSSRFGYNVAMQYLGSIPLDKSGTRKKPTRVTVFVAAKLRE